MVRLLTWKVEGWRTLTVVKYAVGKTSKKVESVMRTEQKCKRLGKYPKWSFLSFFITKPHTGKTRKMSSLLGLQASLGHNNTFNSLHAWHVKVMVFHLPKETLCIPRQNMESIKTFCIPGSSSTTRSDYNHSPTSTFSEDTFSQRLISSTWPTNVSNNEFVYIQACLLDMAYEHPQNWSRKYSSPSP